MKLGGLLTVSVDLHPSDDTEKSSSDKAQESHAKDTEPDWQAAAELAGTDVTHLNRVNTSLEGVFRERKFGELVCASKKVWTREEKGASRPKSRVQKRKGREGRGQPNERPFGATEAYIPCGQR